MTEILKAVRFEKAHGVGAGRVAKSSFSKRRVRFHF